MKKYSSSSADAGTNGPNKLPLAVVFVITILTFTMSGSNALVGDLISAADYAFDEAWESAVAFTLRLPRRLRTQYLDLAIDTHSASFEIRVSVSLGPAGQLRFRSQNFHFSFDPDRWTSEPVANHFNNQRTTL